ncbi:MAG: polyphosphate kinase 2 family protein [Lachnospiraceae bacterium]|jgi:PPK2 family polyphosphate:nucleotide phosphotransferase|nr:polyphosphate kinase 2 family protein [Lachnospiraceae bacterium]
MAFKKYVFDGTKKFVISKTSTNETSLCKDRKDAEAKMQKNCEEIDALQEKLYAEKKEGVIFLFQAMDAAGKDGTIRAVLSALSPHGVHEVAFKAPSSEELAHDYLWRVASKTPAKGEIAIFNRSHYEDVLIGKVRELYRSQANARRIDLDKVIVNRYEDIKNFEEYLYHNNVRTVKIFLNVSKDEQARRFLSRIEEPEKNWKFSGSDYDERAYWDAYQEAFESAINATSTTHCPWYVVPADHKWYMRYVVSEIILATLKEMDPRFPEVTKERLETFAGYKEEILKELPKETKNSKKAKEPKGSKKSKESKDSKTSKGSKKSKS